MKNVDSLVRHGKKAITLSLMLSVSACASFGGKSLLSEDVVDDQTVDGYIQSGDTLSQSGEYNEALVQYLLALEDDELNPDLLHRVGYTHERLGNTGPAVESYRRVLQLNASHLDTRERLALLSLKNENVTYAKALLEAVLDADGVRWESLNGLGIIHDLEQNYDEAQAFYSSAITLMPGVAKLHNNLGYSYYLQGDQEKALEQFERVVTMFPDYDQGWSNLALVYLQRGDEENAKLAFQRIVTEPQAINNIGYYELLNNDMDSARARFTEALKISPSFYSKAQQNLSSLHARNVETEEMAASPTKSNNTISLQTSDADQDNDKLSGPDPVTIAQTNEPAKPSQQVLYLEQVLEAQEKLKALGYYQGQVDGLVGNATIRAVREFQRAVGAKVDGKIDEDLLRTL